eukprot:3707692-Rhodomonas_salina.1
MSALSSRNSMPSTTGFLLPRPIRLVKLFMTLGTAGMPPRGARGGQGTQTPPGSAACQTLLAQQPHNALV